MNSMMPVSPGRVRMPMLLLENDPLLRRTVVLTARSLGIGEVHETGSPAIARRLLREHAFSGAVIALDFGERKIAEYDLGVIDAIRENEGCRDIPVAVLVDYCDVQLLQALRQRAVTRVILKPFRARTLLDTFIAFHEAQPA
ncbi:MAG TPA: response regulator [Noviherbaspirillum sp.]|jgi:CheY-like chemotaxis protein|uniref:response regulator n=1 Tax=Noviherbaspirillum sp. TaxID=1926288 RepID=UPI002F94DA66